MVKIFRNWCEGLVVAVIISIIIEMLVPEGNNKKYIKVVIGLYIVFVIINPILDIFNYDFDLKSILSYDTIETSSSITNYEDNIRQVYINGLENEIKNEVINLGYQVSNVKIFVDKDYTSIKKIELQILGKNENNNSIEPIIIGKEKIQENEYDDLKKFLTEKYLIEEEQIIFK